MTSSSSSSMVWIKLIPEVDDIDCGVVNFKLNKQTNINTSTFLSILKCVVVAVIMT